MENQQASVPTRTVAAIIRLVILLAICGWLFLPEIAGMVAGAYSHSEAAHVLIIPVAILLLAYHRRDALREHVGAGSVWGTVFVVIGIILFSFAYYYSAT